MMESRIDIENGAGVWLDPTAKFCSDCVLPDAQSELTAKEFYQAYANYTVVQRGKLISVTAFGLIMKKKYRARARRAVVYCGVRLRAQDPAEGGKPDRASGLMARPVRSEAEGDSVRTYR